MYIMRKAHVERILFRPTRKHVCVASRLQHQVVVDRFVILLHGIEGPKR